MPSIEITIERERDGSYPVILEEIGDDSLLATRRESDLLLTDATREALRAATLDPIAYGTTLGGALFAGAAKDALVSAFAGARAESVPLRILLVVEDPAVRDLRWERLCIPIDDAWIPAALNQETPLTRYLPSLSDRRFPSVRRRDLRALVLVASPGANDGLTLAPFDVAGTIGSLQEAFGAAIKADLLADVPGAVGSPTLDALAERLTSERYPLLHIVCHGAIDGGEPVLFLTGSNGKPEAVTASRLIERLRNLQSPPYFVFLSACESASEQGVPELGGLGQRLVSELGLPAVVAMADRVTIATAGALAAAFYRQLGAHGQPDLALVQATAGLAERPDILVPVLYSRLGGRALFDDTDRGALDREEIEVGLQAMERELPARAPILLIPDRRLEDGAPEFSRAASILRAGDPADLDALSEEGRREWRGALDDVDAIAREAIDLAFSALARGEQPTPYDSQPPFVGLSPFTFNDSEIFFGRDRLVEEIAARIESAPFLGVLGPSGSGKSSLVFAGLLPRLFPPGADQPWASFRPGNKPQEALESALAKLPAAGGLLVADQFEECFTLCRDAGARAQFFDRLLAELPGRRIVLTMRADFLGDCAIYRKLREQITANQALIPPMTADELRHATEQQANHANLRFEADLAATIMDEIRDEPGAMPLLQHALLELWKRRHGRWIKTSEYRDLGGVKRAISATASAFYGSLDENEQKRVRDIFVRLTRIDEDAVFGAAARDTRRRVSLSDLVPQGEDPAITRALIAKLEDARLLVVSGTGGA